MKKIARLIITLDCSRHCDYCVNEYESTTKQMKPITKVKELAKYDEILITGGEPMLRPERTFKIVHGLRIAYPKKKLYLYTALFHPMLFKILPYLDGMHFTLHKRSSSTDGQNFHYMQDVLSNTWNKKKSFRLYIHPEYPYSLQLWPIVWKRVEMKPWIKEEDMCLPPNEELLILKSQHKQTATVREITSSRKYVRKELESRGVNFI